MTSARPRTHGLDLNDAKSTASSEAPEVPMWVAGTHEEASTSIDSGQPRAHSSMKRMPSKPTRWAGAGGAAPPGRARAAATARANSAEVTIALSTCTWASINPGAR